MSDRETRPASLAAVGRTTLMLAGSAVIVQMIGFGRQLFLAAEIGISSALDAVLIALAAPLALVGIVTAGAATALVPAYAEAKDERGLPAARRLVGAMLVWTGIAGALLSAAIWVLAEPIVAITGPGLEESSAAEEAVRWVRILSPIVFLMSVSGIFNALCQAESLFSVMAIAAVVAPLLALSVMVARWAELGLDGLVLGTVLGALASLVILATATIRRRIAPLPRLFPRGLGMRKVVRHALPLSASDALLQLNLVFDRAVASWLLAGGVSVLRYSDSIIRLPFAAVRPAWSSAVYPALVRASRDPTQSGLAEMTERMLSFATVFFVPLGALSLAVAPVAVATAYDRGSFTSEDLALTAQVVAVSTPLVVTWTLAPTLVSALNARRQGAVMMAATLVNVALNLVLNVVLGYLFGVVGVALATTLVSFVVLAFFVHRLAKSEPTFRPRILGTTLLRATLAVLPSALAFGIPIWTGFVGGNLVERVTLLVIVGVTGLSSYYLIAPRLGLNEANSIVTFSRRTLTRALGRLVVWLRVTL